MQQLSSSVLGGTLVPSVEMLSFYLARRRLNTSTLSLTVLLLVYLWDKLV